MSKIVFVGFMAAWFFADSPIKRSSSVKETNEGVVKLPCSLATDWQSSQVSGPLLERDSTRAMLMHLHTDLDIGPLIIGNTRICST